MLTAVVGTLILSSAFITKESKTKTNDREEYIYLVAYGRSTNNSTDTYISDIIKYEGFDKCGDKLDFYREAGRRFMADIEKSNTININEWKIAYHDGNGYSRDYPDGYFKGYDSRSDAFDARNNQIESRKADDLKTYRTYFSYKCN